MINLHSKNYSKLLIQDKILKKFQILKIKINF